MHFAFAAAEKNQKRSCRESFQQPHFLSINPSLHFPVGTILALSKISLQWKTHLVCHISPIFLSDHSGHGEWILRFRRGVTQRDMGDFDVRAENNLGSSERSWSMRVMANQDHVDEENKSSLNSLNQSERCEGEEEEIEECCSSLEFIHDGEVGNVNAF